jgi:3-oxoacyl-[acyl-carrier protein] reductase
VDKYASIARRFDAQVALITGAARGIGRATAERFAAEGAHVVLVDLDEQAVTKAAEEIAAQFGVPAVGWVVDVGNEDQVDDLVKKIILEMGGLHILVNNAGVTRDNLMFKMSVQDWDLVMNVHLRGAFLCTRAAQRHMVLQRHGKIVNLSSTSALGNRGQSNYSTAKAGLQAFTRTAAIELGPYNINVNAVAPGFVDTEMTRKTAARRGFTAQAYMAERAKSIPLGRVGQPEDIANVIAFLCSEDAAFVSGQIIYVKGGPETVR